MGTTSRELYRKKLRKLLGRADDEAFFTMIWSIHAAQTGRDKSARGFLDFPEQAATTDITSKFSVYPWDCETLLNELLATPKGRIVAGHPNRILDCSRYATLATVTNVLRRLENAEDSVVLRRLDVLKELHRLGQRQFEWQRGLLSHSHLYRSHFVYGGPETGEFFLKNYGLTIEEFSLTTFAMRSLLLEEPAIERGIDMESIGITAQKRDKVFDLISLKQEDARTRTAEIRRTGAHTGYKKSILRQFPCISFGTDGNRIHGPLPDLVTLRSTTGLFYDVIEGGGTVRNEIADRFEKYCLDLFRANLRSSTVNPSMNFLVRKGENVQSPDVLVSNVNGSLSTIVECKARRLSYDARYSEDPVKVAESAYREMSRGIVQIWRFVSHVRHGRVPGHVVSDSAVGMVLTLDNWMSFSPVIRREVLDMANEQAQKNDEIDDRDRIPIVFCTIEELESTFGSGNEHSFHQTLTAAASQDYDGWMLWNVHRDAAPNADHDPGFPYEERLSEVLPWWDKISSKFERH